VLLRHSDDAGVRSDHQHSEIWDRR
jgi:hypothetical protein